MRSGLYSLIVDNPVYNPKIALNHYKKCIYMFRVSTPPNLFCFYYQINNKNTLFLNPKSEIHVFQKQAAKKFLFF